MLNLKECLEAVAQAHKKGPVHGKFKRLADSLTPVASDSPPAAIKKAVEACAAAAVQILSLVDLQLVEVDEPPPAAPGPNKLAEAVERINSAHTVYEALQLDDAKDTSAAVFSAKLKLAVQVFPSLLEKDKDTGVFNATEHEAGPEEQAARGRLESVGRLLLPTSTEAFSIYKEAHAHLKALGLQFQYGFQATVDADWLVEDFALTLIKHYNLFRQCGRVFRRDPGTPAYQTIGTEGGFLLDWLFTPKPSGGSSAAAKFLPYTRAWLKKQPRLHGEQDGFAERKLAAEWPETPMARGFLSCQDGMYDLEADAFLFSGTPEYDQAVELGAIALMHRQEAVYGSPAPVSGPATAAGDPPAPPLPPGYAKLVGPSGQNFSEKKLLVFEALMGRALYKVGHHDNWRVCGMLNGEAGCGKTILAETLKRWYPSQVVAILNGGSKAAVGSYANLKGSMLVYGPEAPRDGYAGDSNFRELFNKLAAGEGGVQIQEPGKPVHDVEGDWEAPLIFTGNCGLRWPDSKGSRRRRVAYIVFPHTPGANGDTTLEKQLEREALHIAQRWNRAYKKVVQLVGGRTFLEWHQEFDPETVAEGDMLEQGVNRTAQFLQECLRPAKAGLSVRDANKVRCTLAKYNTTYTYWMRATHPNAKLMNFSAADMQGDVHAFALKHSLANVCVQQFDHSRRLLADSQNERSHCWLLGALVTFYELTDDEKRLVDDLSIGEEDPSADEEPQQQGLGPGT